MNITEILTIAGTILGTLGGSELIRYFINRKSNARKAEAEADSSEFGVLRETTTFLQEQLKDKELRFADQTALVRKLNAENLDLTRDNSMLKTERELKLCQRRNCKDREPQTGY